MIRFTRRSDLKHIRLSLVSTRPFIVSEYPVGGRKAWLP